MIDLHIERIGLLTVLAYCRSHAEGVRHEAAGHWIFHVGLVQGVGVGSLFSFEEVDGTKNC